MSGQTSGGYEDDPYVWQQQGQIDQGDPQEVDFENPARAFFDGMADFRKRVGTRRHTVAP